MKVNELIEKYKKNNNIDLAKILEVKKYISIGEKIAFANMVFNGSARFNNGLIEVDSTTRYLCFTMGIINMYTNIEYGDDVIADYDALCENGLIDKIIATFEEDYGRTATVVNNYFNDQIANHNTIPAILAGLSQSISNSVDDMVKTVNENTDLSGLSDLFVAN